MLGPRGRPSLPVIEDATVYPVSQIVAPMRRPRRTSSRLPRPRRPPVVKASSQNFVRKEVSERSRPWDLNPRPAVYETAALPLS